ncbi:Receptor-type tyrosine-protein phosphatase-like protein [Leptotrombidium deliense]|uniref:protein-tyrosine-phosphatase n=1 Tax=Leptotrombidium deliense TaxID=299467 RepID=A0A443SG87_9ACAR|nr:Receptor-type tyrosine-protein phosphatase-like protein [Leptotrombidium deliense]
MTFERYKSVLSTAAENKTIGEFCEKRLQEPVFTKVAEIEEYFKTKNESGDLKTEYENVPLGVLFAADDAEKEENKPKNRYEGRYPAYDHSRVKIDKIGDGSLGDYINANWVPGVNLPKRYILTQGPLRSTANDFWRLVWENEASIIVMLTRLRINGEEKCFKYWPEDSARYGLIEVVLEKSDYLTDYVVRTFLVQYRKEVRRVVQYHFLVWPDEGVPENPETVLNFVKLIRSSSNYVPYKPIVVHCAGGMGRSGTFTLIDAMLQAAEKKGELDIAQQLCAMRQARVNLVETFPQYILAHEAIIKGGNVAEEKAN